MLNNLIQGSLAILFVWILSRALPRLSASTRCWLWRVVALRFVVALFTAIPIQSSVRETQVPTALIHPFATISKRATLTYEPEARVFQTASVSRLTDPTLSTSLDPARAMQVAWSVGFMANLGVVLLALTKSSGLVRRSSAVAGGLLLPNVGRASVRVCDEIGAPAVVGIWHPTILLPSDSSNRTPEALTAAINHELAHIKRHDLIWTFSMSVWRSLFWFHPMVWIAEREHRIESEIAADQLGRTFSQATSKQYGMQILEWLSSPVAGAKPSPAMLMSTEQIKRRLRALATSPYRKSGQLLACTVIAVPLFITLAPAVVNLQQMKLVKDESGVFQLAIPKRPGKKEVLLSAKHNDRQIAAIVKAHDLDNPFNPKSVEAVRRLESEGTGGPVFEADLPTGETIRLLGISCLDPVHVESWAADGTPLQHLLPFTPTQAFPPEFVTSSLSATSNAHIENTTNFLRQVLFEVRGTGINFPYAFMQVDGEDVKGYPQVESEGGMSDLGSGAPWSPRKSSIDSYKKGKLFTTEHRFMSTARSAEVTVFWTCPSALYSEVRIRNGVGQSSPHDIEWKIFPAGQIDVREPAAHIDNADTLILANLAPLMLKNDNGYQLNSELEMTAEDAHGKVASMINLRTIVEPVVASTKRPVGKGPFGAWVLKGMKPEEVRKLRITRTEQRSLIFKNVQLNPIR